jgi:hypothetical protein
MALPVWGLYDSCGGLVATIRAGSAEDARELFRLARLRGERVRRLAA